MQQPTTLLAILSRMAQKPQVKFDKLYQKLYNPDLWRLAYQGIAPTPGNMTAGVDGKTIDGMSEQLIADLIADLKASRYRPRPVRRVYIPKANGDKRPLGIPSFRDKLLQSVLKLILEAIYEPTFSPCSHGFRPQRSCHTALQQVKTTMVGTRWWIEGDIHGFFDHLEHETLLTILGKRITDKRFLHVIEQLLKTGYVEDWRYHQTYSGVPQGGNLSPLLANIYLHELDEAITQYRATFQRGRQRKTNKHYQVLGARMRLAKQRARQTGDWRRYKALRAQRLSTPASNHLDPDYRRLRYVRYADDFLIGIIGTKAEATAIKAWLQEMLREKLHLKLSAEKTLVTHARKRVCFLGYDIQRWRGKRVIRMCRQGHSITRRTGSFQLRLWMPRKKAVQFARRYGNTTTWRGKRRSSLLSLSELEILMTYNAEVRGFLNYYALADNLTAQADKILRISTTSFFHTLADKRQSTCHRVARSLKREPGRFVISVEGPDQRTKEYELFSSTRQLQREVITYPHLDQQPNVLIYRNKTELGQRWRARQCEWCGRRDGPVEVHHVRKLGDLSGKAIWERRMIERRRKTMVLCVQCHDELHAGILQVKRPTAQRELASRIR